LQAVAISASTSPLPPRHLLEATEWAVVFVGHRQNPSACLATMTTPRKPVSLKIRHHCRQSIWSGAKRSGDSPPRPVSMSVNVLIPKWTKASISRLCQAHWLTEGTGPAGAGSAAMAEAHAPRCEDDL
jgi:hypothetical protein